MDYDVDTACLYGKDPFPEDHFTVTGSTVDLTARFASSLQALIHDATPFDCIGIVDCGDMDGVASAALYAHKFEGNMLLLPAGYRDAGPDPLDAIEKVVDVLVETDQTYPLYIADLGPNEHVAAEWRIAIKRAASAHIPIHWRDHHSKVPSVCEAVIDSPQNTYIHDTTRSGAEIVLDTDYPDAPEYLQEAVRLAGVGDLFKTDHPRFDEAREFGAVAEYAPFTDAYRAVAEHGLRALTAGTLGDELQERLDMKQQRIQWAVENAVVQNVSGHTVAFVHGDVPTSDAGRVIYSGETELGTVDFVVFTAPESTKVSFRSNPAVFDYCADIASQLFDGGGHPGAAGGRLDFEQVGVTQREHTEDHGVKAREHIISQLLNHFE